MPDNSTTPNVMLANASNADVKVVNAKSKQDLKQKHLLLLLLK